ncbi:hypothetical protein A5790_22650 [Mycobacterium sp. 852002-51152_SCH6134967]|nr:hypothetical protein A5790_22650 [Mycobacterium sp. 852002-51152_SCH6134967]
MKTGSQLVLVSPTDFGRLKRGEKTSGCWSFALRREMGRTHLVVRGSGGAVGHSWFDIPHFVVEQKMMRGIAQRAPRTRGREITEALNRHPSGRRSRRLGKVSQST